MLTHPTRPPRRLYDDVKEALAELANQHIIDIKLDKAEDKNREDVISFYITELIKIKTIQTEYFL